MQDGFSLAANLHAKKCTPKTASGNNVQRRPEITICGCFVLTKTKQKQTKNNNNEKPCVYTKNQFIAFLSFIFIPPAMLH